MVVSLVRFHSIFFTELTNYYIDAIMFFTVYVLEKLPCHTDTTLVVVPSDCCDRGDQELAASLVAVASIELLGKVDQGVLISFLVAYVRGELPPLAQHRSSQKTIIICLSVKQYSRIENYYIFLNKMKLTMSRAIAYLNRNFNYLSSLKQKLQGKFKSSDYIRTTHLILNKIC